MSEPTDPPLDASQTPEEVDPHDRLEAVDDIPEDPEPLDPEHPFFTHEPIEPDGEVETWSVTEMDDIIYR